jgi:glucose/arabinose dehydrogenase
MANEVERACILEDRSEGRHARVYASGLAQSGRTGVGAVNGALWVAVNERDELGSDLVPDYITSVREGAFYGWPTAITARTSTQRVKPPRPDLVRRRSSRITRSGRTHASLGLAYSSGADRAPIAATGMFVGQHGSWNRKPRSGYKVIFVPFAVASLGDAAGRADGFVKENGDAMGRPVGVAIARDGALLSPTMSATRCGA